MQHMSTIRISSPYWEKILKQKNMGKDMIICAHMFQSIVTEDEVWWSRKVHII